MKALFLTVILMAFASCGNAQVKTKTEKEMKQEIAKLEELIKEKLQMVKTYPEKPAYYLQINKTGCRLLVRVDDIPIGYHFVENEGNPCYIPLMTFYSEAENIRSASKFILAPERQKLLRMRV